MESLTKKEHEEKEQLDKIEDKLKSERSAETTIQNNLATSLKNLSINMDKEMKMIESKSEIKINELKKHE